MQSCAVCFQHLSFGLERATQNGSGEGKSRIPSGIEGWAGFLPPAIPAGLDSTYPSRTPGGGVFAFLRFSFEVPGAPSSVCEGGAFALNQQVFTRQAQTPHRGSYRPRKIRVNYLGSFQPGWGVVQSVGHLTVNEDGVGSSPTAPANPSALVCRESQRGPRITLSSAWAGRDALRSPENTPSTRTNTTRASLFERFSQAWSVPR